ncbi:MAG: serine/threonine protein kinase, partial [Planctomycetes bacterium]|nr:serine/threonine protein kinase [Planctomycetota bacterium]
MSKNRKSLMQPEKDSRPSSLSTQHLMQINQLCNDFEAHCQSGTIPRIEAWLKGISSEIYPVALRELLILEMEYRQPTGDSVTLAELKSRFPIVETSVLQQLIVNPNLESSNVDILRSTPTPLVTNGETEEIPEVLGDYRLIERIGGGGMGDVYKAVHQRMRRFVAIKVLRSEIKSDSQFNRRFEREVRAAARLTHPNIVAALDAREDNGVHYLVTEFVDGCDLDKAVKQSGPFPCDIAMDYILQAARGLEYAHRQGIVHRDIKPANLLRDNTGVVKLLDMGLARFRSNEEPDDADLTKSGMIMGTAAYMAPEQARNTRNADSKSDIYSLGCTLYFLMTGRPIYSAESVVDAILSHASQPAPRLHQPGIEIPVELEEV